MIKSILISIMLLVTPLATFANNKVVSKPVIEKSFKYSKTQPFGLVESDLEVDVYLPGDSMMNDLLSIDIIKNSSGKNAIKLQVNSQKIIKILKEEAQRAGLLTGNTLFEKWIKDDTLVIDYKSLLQQINVSFKKTDGKTTHDLPLNYIMPYQATFWSSENETIEFVTRANVEEIYIKPNILFSELTFVQKGKYVKSYGALLSSSTFSTINLKRMFRESDAEENNSSRTSAFWTFNSNLNKMIVMDFIPKSSTLTVIKANQNSEEQELTEGLNLKGEVLNKARPLPWSPHLLLLSSLMIMGPYIYYLIRKVFKK